MAEEATQPMETEQKQEAGAQSSTIAPSVDLSKLAILQNLNDVFIKQPIRDKEFLVEMFCGCEMSNFYTVNQVDQNSKAITPLFNLSEESAFCMRQWYDPCIYQIY